MTSSFFLFVNSNPHWPSILAESLCKFDRISSHSVLPRARAITLFLPNKNLKRLSEKKIEVFLRLIYINIQILRFMYILFKELTHLLSFHIIRIFFSFPFRMLFVWKINTCSNSSTAFWTFFMTFCFRSFPFFCVLVSETIIFELHF